MVCYDKGVLYKITLMANTEITPDQTSGTMTQLLDEFISAQKCKSNFKL